MSPGVSFLLAVGLGIGFAITGAISGVTQGYLPLVVPLLFLAGSLYVSILGIRGSDAPGYTDSAFVPACWLTAIGSIGFFLLFALGFAQNLYEQWYVARFCEARGKLTGMTSEIQSRGVLFIAESCNSNYEYCRSAKFEGTRAIGLLNKGFEFVEYQNADIGTFGPRRIFARVYLTSRPNPDCDTMDREFGSTLSGKVNAVDHLARYGIPPTTCVAIQINQPPQSEYSFHVKTEEESGFFSSTTILGATLSTVRDNKHIAGVESIFVGGSSKQGGHSCRNHEEVMKLMNLVSPPPGKIS